MTTEALTIGPGVKVTLNFAIRLENGDTVDSTFDAHPATFEVGDGNLLDGFEEVLFGMSAGSRETFIIQPENGFGQHNPNNVQEIPRSEFDPSMQLEEGLMVSFADAANTELPGVIAAIHDDIVEVDFNHPLAGRELHFEVEIISLEPATKH